MGSCGARPTAGRVAVSALTKRRAWCTVLAQITADREERAMTPSTPGTHQIDIEEVEYVRHGTEPQLARLFKPRGTGPFPLMVSLHGGAWCRESRMTDEVIHEVLAKTGVVVASLDFRMPPTASYPGTMIDINYGIRWLKTRAGSLNARADAVGVMGTSSGGHQGMLSAMRPKDSRYASL